MRDILDDSPLHRLWSKAVGTPDYDKSEWKALERKLHAALSGRKDRCQVCSDVCPLHYLFDMRIDGLPKVTCAACAVLYLGRKVNALRAAAEPCVAILAHKEIRPPMNEGVQEKLLADLTKALEKS